MHITSRRRLGSTTIASLVLATTVVALPGAASALEVLTDDFRISQIGPDGAAAYEAQQAKVAYSATSKRFLTVWRGDDEGDGQAEIYGQLINAATGAATGPDDFVIARIGPAGQSGTDAIEPAVAWNSTADEFVVTFTGDEDNTDSGVIISDTFEIYAQRVAVDGSLAGSALRVSDMGAVDTSGSYDANFSDIAFNSTANEFLVVWQGDDNTAPLVNNETEVFGQRLGYSAGNLVEVGTNDVRISTVGVDGATTTDGRAPAVAYNANGNQYYVAWEGNYDVLNVGVFDIHGTTVSAAGAVASSTGTVLNTVAASDEEYAVDVAANPTTGEFMAVWMGDNGANEFEISRQRVTSAGALTGSTALISAMGSAGNVNFIAQTPAITYDSLQQQYVTVWAGDDNTAGMVDDEYEVFLRRMASDGSTAGGQARLSTMGIDGTVNSTTSLPDVAFSDATLGDVGVVWNAENLGVTGAGEGEIWGQFDAPGMDLSLSAPTASDTSPAPGTAVTVNVPWAVTGATVPSVTINAIATGPGSLVSGTALLGAQPSGAGATQPFTVNVDAGAVNGATITVDLTISSGSLLKDTATGNNTASLVLTVDAPPTVTIDQAAGQFDPSNAATVNFTATFSEPVSGFTGADVSFTGSTVGGTPSAAVTGGPTVYNVAVTGQDGVGTIVASVPAGGATDLDGNSADANGASTSTDNVVTFDNVAPTVTIDQAAGQSDPTKDSPVVFTVTFSEPVSGFAASDVSFSGSTVGGTPVAAVSAPTGNTYTVSVTGITGQGTVIASVPAAGASDAAGNGNDASTSTDNSVTYDGVPPTVTIEQSSTPPAQADPTNAAPVVFDVVFSETVTGFAGSDLSFVGSTVGGTLVAAVSVPVGNTYTVSVTGMSGEGSVVVSIPAGSAADAVGNLSEASTSTDNTVSFDDVDPTVTAAVQAGQANPTNGSPVEFTVTFSEAVTGFSTADVDLSSSTTGGTLVASVGAPTGNVYPVSVTGMAGSGNVTMSVLASAAADAAGNTSTASNSVSVGYDVTAPIAVVSAAAGQPDPTSGSSITFTVAFGESVSGFDTSDLTLVTTGTASGSVGTITGSGPYTVTVTGVTGDGSLGLRVNANSVLDTSGNPNPQSNVASVAVDHTSPTVTIEQAVGQVDPANVGPVVFTVLFSEPVTGFDPSDVDVSASTVGGTLVAAVTGSGAGYTVSVTGMSGTGDVIASIPADAASDAAGNGTLASTSSDNTVAFDGVVPIVGVATAIGQATPTNTSPIQFVVQFSEPVTGFDASDVTFPGHTAGGTLVAVTAGGPQNYTVAVTGMTTSGTVSIQVPAGSATDGSGNANTISGTAIVVWDVDAPETSIEEAAGQADPTNVSSIEFTLTTSEALVGLDTSDFTVSGSGGGTVASLTGGPLVYTVTVTAAGPGTVTLALASGKVADAAGNANVASASTDDTVTYDPDKPTVTIEQAVGQADPANVGPVVFTVLFSESVTGFDASDVDVSASTVGGTLVAAVTGSDAGYTVSISGASGTGDVIVSIAADAATDAAGNTNTASTSADNTVSFDDEAPTVTVAQAAAQPDPTNVASVEFDVVFSEPVTGFTVSDVVLGGTAAPTTALISGTGPAYTVTVTGMTGFGTVTATIAAGATGDAAGNASTSPTNGDNVVLYVPGDPNPGVNDAPAITGPSSASAELGVAVALTGSNAVSVTDPDAFADDIRVTLTATDGTIDVSAAAGVSITGNGTAVVTLVGSQTAIATVLSGASVTFTEVGAKTVVVGADDLGHSPAPARTSSKTITFTVSDTTPPVITLPNSPVRATAEPGKAGATVTYVVIVTDQGSDPTPGGLTQAAAPTFTCSPSSGSFFPIGTTTVTCTAQDSVGNTSTASFAVVVSDTEKPVITAPATPQRVALPTGATSGPLAYALPTVSDNSGTVTVTCTPTAGTIVPAGVVTVTCTATDQAGNASTVSFAVTVVSGALPPTGGGGGPAPIALASLLAGLALVAGSRRRRA